MIRDVLAVGSAPTDQRFFCAWQKQEQLNRIVEKTRDTKFQNQLVDLPYPVPLYGVLAPVPFLTIHTSYWNQVSEVVGMNKAGLVNALSFLLQRGAITPASQYMGMSGCTQAAILESIRCDPEVLCMVSVVSTRPKPLSDNSIKKIADENTNSFYVQSIKTPDVGVLPAASVNPVNKSSAFGSSRGSLGMGISSEPIREIECIMLPVNGLEGTLCTSAISKSIKLNIPYMHHRAVLYKGIGRLNMSRVGAFEQAVAGIFADIAGRDEFYDFTIPGRDIHPDASTVTFTNYNNIKEMRILNTVRKRMLYPIPEDVLAMLDFMQNNFTVPVGGPGDVQLVDKMRTIVFNNHKSYYTALVADREARKKKADENKRLAEIGNEKAAAETLESKDEAGLVDDTAQTHIFEVADVSI